MGSSEKLVLISRTSKRERSSARTTSSGVVAAIASKRLLRNNASTRSWQLMATASATRTLVLRTELETDSNGNSTQTAKRALQKGEELRNSTRNCSVSQGVLRL